jgi:hypothetical protein
MLSADVGSVDEGVKRRFFSANLGVRAVLRGIF